VREFTQASAPHGFRCMRAMILYVKDVFLAREVCAPHRNSSFSILAGCSVNATAATKAIKLDDSGWPSRESPTAVVIVENDRSKVSQRAAESAGAEIIDLRRIYRHSRDDRFAHAHDVLLDGAPRHELPLRQPPRTLRSRVPRQENAKKTLEAGVTRCGI